jgi:hypothetical protein
MPPSVPFFLASKSKTLPTRLAIMGCGTCRIQWRLRGCSLSNVENNASKSPQNRNNFIQSLLRSETSQWATEASSFKQPVSTGMFSLFKVMSSATNMPGIPQHSTVILLRSKGGLKLIAAMQSLHGNTQMRSFVWCSLAEPLSSSEVEVVVRSLELLDTLGEADSLTTFAFIYIRTVSRPPTYAGSNVTSVSRILALKPNPNAISRPRYL